MRAEILALTTMSIEQLNIVCPTRAELRAFWQQQMALRQGEPGLTQMREDLERMGMDPDEVVGIEPRNVRAVWTRAFREQTRQAFAVMAAERAQARMSRARRPTAPAVEATPPAEGSPVEPSPAARASTVDSAR